MALNEELIAKGTSSFQQFFVSFLDCERQPEESDPLKVFDPHARRRFVRSEMWIFDPAEELVLETVRLLQDTWARFHAPSPAPPFDMQSGRWVTPRFSVLGRRQPF
jgi:hypothetical protein